MSVLDERKFSVPQAAKALGVCKQVVYEMVRDGEIKALRIRNKLIITEGELERFLGAAGYKPPDKSATLERPRRTTVADLLPAGEHSSAKALDTCLAEIRRH